MQPLKTVVAYSTPWFDLLAKTMKSDEAPYYSLRIADYAAIVAITEDQRVLAVRQYRPALERCTIELPSGLVDAGEEPAQCARRELMEETGYEAVALEPLGAMTTDNGRLTNQIWGFLATGVRQVETWQPEAGVDVLTYSRQQLAEAIARGEFDHSLHLGVLMLAVVKRGIVVG
jgi:ADP-ribose pyrophosphatase